MDVVNLAEKLSRFTDRWSPKIVGEINDMPKGTLNTGDVVNERTVSALDRL